MRKPGDTPWTGSLQWLIPALILTAGLTVSAWSSHVLTRQARLSWEENAEQVAQWLSGSLLDWMEESYASLSGIAALYENSDQVTEDEFLNAFDAIEARATAFFLDAIAVARRQSGDDTRWAIAETSNPFGMLSPNGLEGREAALDAALAAAEARFGRIVLGPPIRDNEERTVSIVALITQSPNAEIALLGILNFDSIVDGLRQVHLPPHVTVSLSGRFQDAANRGDKRTIVASEDSGALLTLTTRTISAEAEIIVHWHFGADFNGGPNEALGRTTLWTGIVISVLIGGVVAILIAQNRKIAKRVAERTAELSLRERELSRQKAILETTLETMDQGVSMFDADLNLMAFNRRFLRIFDYADEDVRIGTNLEALLRRTYSGADEDAFVEARLAQVGRFEPIQNERQLPSGRFIDVRGNPIPGGRGFVTTFADVTDRKRADRALKDAYAQIASSIEYASYIQRSLLPDHDALQHALGDHFVIWQPRDVVGGDLYWLRQWGTGTLVALGDCTGHGVPGAFMTLIATAALDRSLSETTPGQVGHLIQSVHRRIQATLGQHSQDGLSDDGMEIGVVYLSHDGDRMTFGGAKFPLFAKSGPEITQFRGARRGVGFTETPKDQAFTQMDIRRSDFDAFFLASDGVFDQTGGGSGAWLWQKGVCPDAVGHGWAAVAGHSGWFASRAHDPSGRRPPPG